MGQVAGRAKGYLQSLPFQSAMMTSHHILEDNSNGQDRVRDHTLTHKCHRYRKYTPWSSKSLLQIQMRSNICESLIIDRTIADSRATKSLQKTTKIQIAWSHASTNTSTNTFTIWPAAPTCQTSCWRASDPTSGQSEYGREISNCGITESRE